MKQAIADIMASGRSSDAVHVGRKILNACTKFFEKVQKDGHKGMTSGFSAAAEMRQLSTDAEQMHLSLQDVRKHSRDLVLPNNLRGFGVSLLRQWGYRANPDRVLTRDFNSASQRIETSLLASENLLRGYEDFQSDAPQINTQLEELCGELDTAIETLDSEIAPYIAAGNDVLPPEAQNKIRLKDMLESIRFNATATKGFVAVNARTCGIMLDTEAKFAASVMGVQSAINAISTAMIMTMAEIKQAAMPTLDDEVRQTIEVQIAKASESFAQLSQIAMSRNADMGRLAKNRQKELTLQVA